MSQKGPILIVALLALSQIVSEHAVAANAGFGTTQGVQELPLTVEGVTGVDLFSSSLSPSQLQQVPGPNDVPPNLALYGDLIMSGPILLGNSVTTGGGATPKVVTPIAAGNSCATEALLGYDSTHHMPVYCNSSNKWASLSSAPPQTWYEIYDFGTGQTHAADGATRCLNSDAAPSSSWSCFYTNTTSDPIAVSMGFYAPAGGNGYNAEGRCQVTGVTMLGDESIYGPSGASNETNTYRGQVFFIVPAGATYSCNGGGGDTGQLAYWAELRDSPP